MVVYVILVFITCAVVLWSAVQDLRERMIYVFPITMLHILWSVYLYSFTEWPKMLLAVFWILHLCLYLVLNRFSVWGSGDSDMFLLFADIVLATSVVMNGYSVAIMECLYLIAGLLISIVIGVIESRIRNRKMAGMNEIAVVPGLAIVMIVVIVRFYIWRWM
jgi:hypothetical protein